ncbi:MAG: sulfatase-like hydrolase/transferase [Lachnospiraceae bacterium]|nr:sulfatase-like hydrolase/transferase [Lachnospiraceae bacterium]
MSKKRAKQHTKKNTHRSKNYTHQYVAKTNEKKSINWSGYLPKIIWFIRNLIPMILFPIVTFYLFEWYTHNPFETMKIRIQFLNIFFFELIMIILFMLFGILKAALLTETVFFMIYGLANFYVLSFRSAPIMPWDIYSIKTAASVSGDFSYALEKETIFVLLGFAVLILLECFTTWKVNKSLKVRIGGFLASVCVLIGFVNMLHLDSTVTRFKLYDKLFTPTVMSKRDGTAIAFLMELEYLTIDKPDNYSPKTAEEMLASYASDSTAEPENKPNIIVIMNEAFSDPAILGEFETNEDYMPLVHSLITEGNDNTISGNLNVSVLGGNTANTEFEFLTGNTMAFLPQGSVAYQQYVHGELPTMASLLRDYGYKTIAMHPYNSTGWERNTVYPNFGFQESFFIRDFKNPEKIRKYVSDLACYEKIVEEFHNKEKDTPLFVFNVTMQNHSSYTEEFDNFTPDITVNNAKSKTLNNYLSLMKISDEAIKKLVNYFSEQDEDTIIVFFGDHQPTNSVISPIWKLNGKSSSTLSLEDETLRYKVPFFIWANYDIAEASNIETSPNFLGNKVLEAAGIPLSDFRGYLAELEQSYPVVSSIRAEDASGNSYEIKEVEDSLNDYAILQYYYLLDSE